MTDPAIEARGLEKRFGPVFALRGLDLDVPTRTLLAVLGPNGSGKSTLLRLLAGLARPSAGTLRVGGDAADRRAARARIGFVGHATLLYPELTARENLLFAARLYRVPDPAARVEQLLAEEGLAPFADRRTRTFSQGLAQRLAIARALVHDPPIVLLDEPFAGLDSAAAARVSERLRRVRDAGRTAVFVTHDLRRVADLADAAIVLARGRIVHQTLAPPLDASDLEDAMRRVLDEAR